jgi:hypothetical protein
MKGHMRIVAISALLLGAGPVDEGHHSTLGLGFSNSVSVDDDYTAREGVLLAEHTLRSLKGWTLSFEGSTAVGSRDYLVPLEPWQRDSAGVAVVRGGINGRYAGIELGPGFWIDARTRGPVISTNVWLGHPFFHGFVETWPGELVGDVDTARVGAGIGHHSEWARAEVSRWGSTDRELEPLLVRVELPLMDRLWVGVRARRYQSSSRWSSGSDQRVLLTVSADPMMLRR